MNIGVSLPLGYLTGAEDGAGAKSLSTAFGSPRDCLAELKDHGVTYIELQGFGPDTPPDTFLAALERISGSEMRLSLHGYLSGDIISHLLSAVASLEGRQEDTVLVVHPLAHPGGTYATMAEATARALERLAEDIRTHDLPVSIALEINRYHGIESPGTAYDGLLEIARLLGDDAKVGFCWDMGHTASSVLQKRLPSAPPPEFAARVTHTHLHNVSPKGDTHWPLTESCPHLTSGISRLEGRGYMGIYNLELYPTRWEAEHDVKDGMLRSILCLRKLMDNIRCHRQSAADESVEQSP